jgi:hypothetical protein
MNKMSTDNYVMINTVVIKPPALSWIACSDMLGWHVLMMLEEDQSQVQLGPAPAPAPLLCLPHQKVSKETQDAVVILVSQLLWGCFLSLPSLRFLMLLCPAQFPLL